MAQITATITGVARDAQLNWDSVLKPLANTGGGGFQAAFTTPKGNHLYDVVLWGNPGDPWTVKVTDGTTTHNFQGHMSPAGSDVVGITAFQAT